MPYRDEYSDAFVSDVFGCVVISVMTNATAGTGPETIGERKLFIAAMSAPISRKKGWVVTRETFERMLAEPHPA